MPPRPESREGSDRLPVTFTGTWIGTLPAVLKVSAKRLKSSVFAGRFTLPSPVILITAESMVRSLVVATPPAISAVNLNTSNFVRLVFLQVGGILLPQQRFRAR